MSVATATRKVLLGLGIISVGVALAHAHSGDSRAQEEIRGLEQFWLLNDENPQALEIILADDFVHVLPTGIVSKREQIDYFKSRKTQSASRGRVFERLDIRIYAKMAVATGIAKAISRGADEPNRTAFTDVFVKRSGQWKAVNAQENRMDEDNPGN